MDYKTKILELIKGLSDRGYYFTAEPIGNGYQVFVSDGNKEIFKAFYWDFSYGSKYGLIEITGDLVDERVSDRVMTTTVEEILNALDNKTTVKVKLLGKLLDMGRWLRE